MFKELNNEEGFTLIEILIVVVIIGFLASTVGPNLFNRVSQAEETTVRNQISIFRMALDNYRLDNGSYPADSQGLKALVKEPTTSPRPQNWDGPYLDSTSLPKDPWGNDYSYKFPGDFNKHSYDVWSEGASIEEDRIGNWE